MDELTRQIKSGLNLSQEQIAGDFDEEVGKITTSSPEAYRYYAEGRTLHLNGEYQKSISLMERAVRRSRLPRAGPRCIRNLVAGLRSVGETALTSGTTSGETTTSAIR